MVKTNDNKAFAVIQFTNVDDAHRAMSDANFPKPMQYSSRPAKRLILFYLPHETNEDIMLTIRGLSNKIVEITVDWIERSAVISFESSDDSSPILKQLRQQNQNNFGEHRVAIDYCSERLNKYFLQRRKDNIANSKKISETPGTSVTNHNANSCEPSTSSQSEVSSKELWQEKESGRPSRYEQECTLQNQEEEEEEEVQEVISRSLDSPEPPTRQSGSSPDSTMSSDSEDDNDENEAAGSGHDPNNDDDGDDNDENYENDENIPELGYPHREYELSGYNDEYDDDHSREGPSGQYSTQSSSHRDSVEKEPDPVEFRKKSLSSNYETDSPSYEMEIAKVEVESECSPSTSSPQYFPIQKVEIELPENNCSRMLGKMRWRDGGLIATFSQRIDEVYDENMRARAIYEKWTGRPLPKFTSDDELRPRKVNYYDSRDYFLDCSMFNELDLRIREWRRLTEFGEFETFRALDPKELAKEPPPLSRSGGRPSLDESRYNRLSLDSHHHHHAELTQRSNSLCIGPMTPATPYPTTMPLLVNTSQQHGPSQPSTSGITTPRSTQPPIYMSPVSRHNSVSSVGRPANIQTLRHQSMVQLPDLSHPPPPIPTTHEDLMAHKDAQSHRRSSETMVSLRSPPFSTNSSNIPNLVTMATVLPPTYIKSATGTNSVSSSAHSTPRNSISGTPVPHEPPSSKSIQSQTPKSNRPEKVQIRHDSISKPSPSNAVNALQARSQSMTAGEYKKSAPSTPVTRDAGSELVAKIMSNQPPSMNRKLPRIEKKPSALQNIHNQPSNANSMSTPSTPLSSHQAMLLKDKEKEKRRKERELGREREARKEMKRKETKEERHKRKEMERAKREEEERKKQKEERRREKEKEKKRKKSEKDKEKSKKKKHRRDDDSDESGSASDDDRDFNSKKSTKGLTQEEKDHQLALILSGGGITDNVKLRRNPQQKNQAFQRRVLIESSDDDGGDDDDDDEKDEKDDRENPESSDEETSDTEKQSLPPPPVASLLPTKYMKPKPHKEREKGELSSSSEDDENKNEQDLPMKQRLEEDRENRKRQKSLTNYSSDEHNERKLKAKRVKRDDSEDTIRHNAWVTKEEQNLRKRKLEHRQSSEDESRTKAKQRDFRDIPHEDVSDEEEVEETSRIRRQSSSSNASNKESNGRKEKAVKTPLRVVTPSGTPLQSPKILSPKILSPKSSSTSLTKRPSISDQESLVSPRSRNRTTSSTSTATTASKHEITSSMDKPLSSPVTAKSSVSSIDDLVIREDFNSDVGSPMSTSGRPLVLTKAAMKVFNSSPPKKQSSSSGPHESSSGSSSSSSSSEGSSTSSSDDSSDEETLKPAARVLKLGNVPETLTNEDKEDSSIETKPPPANFVEVDPIIPTLAGVDSENIVESEADIAEKTDEKATPLSSFDSKPLDEVYEAALSDCKQTSIVVELEEGQNSPGLGETAVTLIEKPETHECGHEKIETNPIITPEEIIEPDREEKREIENVATSTAEQSSSSTPMEVTPISQEALSSSHTLISDQETDQAVQSIFDEEEADEFPQYPDFFNEEEKEGPIKAATPPEAVTNEKPFGKEPSLDYRLTNGHSNHHPSSEETTSVLENVSNKPEEPMETMDSPFVETETQQSVEKIEEEEEEVSPAPSPIKVDVAEDFESDGGDKGLKIVDSPEQTPTPELISNDNIQTEESVQVEPIKDDNEQENSVHAGAPVQPQKPLEIFVPQQQQQVIQPSPRAAATPISQQQGGQPVSVVQNTRSELLTPNGTTPVTIDHVLLEQLFTSGRISEVATILQNHPELGDSMRPDLLQAIRHVLLQTTHGSLNTYQTEITALPVASAAQHQEHASITAQKHKELLETQRILEEKRRKEELDRRREVDRLEKKRRSDERLNFAAAQKAAQKNRKINGRNMDQMNPTDLMSEEAKSFIDISLLTGYPQLIRHEHNGLINGSHSPLQQLHRPSSTASTSSNSARTPLQPSLFLNRGSVEPQDKEGFHVQRWFYNMSAEESATAVATTASNPTPPTTSTSDLATMLQQIQAAQAAQHVPVVTAASAPNPLINLEALLNTASLANIAAGGALNPLSMLALTSSLNQSSPVYQGIARVLLTMNMGQMLATHQTSELLATMNQQDTLMSLLATRSGLPFPFPQQNQQSQQHQAQTQGGFAIPQVLPHMSLKRNNKDQLNVGATDRKKSCPPLAMASGQGQQQQPVVASNVAPPPRSPSPPRKSMFENLPPEMKEKNEMFRKEILRRLDIILLEELGAEDEEEVEKKPDVKQIPTSEEDTDESRSRADSMGAEGSAFRRILSRSSTIGNNSSSPSASGTTSPSTTSSLSSGLDSPTLESDPLSTDFLNMLTRVAQKHREQSASDALSAKIIDEAAFTQHFPMVWTGRLALKSTETMINLHLINGSETFLNDVLGRQITDENPRRDSVKILQRLRLDNGQVEHIYGILTNPEYACCLALSSVNDYDNLLKNELDLKASFIDYLTKKQIAGISSLEEVETKFKSARVHVFAPGEMVNKYLSELASSLHDYLQNTDTRYLLIVFTNDKVEPNMDGPPSVASLAVPPLSS